MKKAEPGTSTTFAEKILYSFGDVGNNFVWSFTSSFLVLYYTDSVLISAGAVGSMMFLARVFDGGSDILMGLVIEKTHTRFGKARPWLLFGSIPLAVSLLLIFNVPSVLSDGGKNIYIFVTYFFMTVICYTAVNLAYYAMLARITLSQHERAVISVYRIIIALLAVLGISFATPTLLEMFGGTKTQHAWTSVSSIYAVLALAFLLMCFFGTKEKVPLGNQGGTVLRTPIKNAFGILLKTKYFYLAAFLNIVMTVFNGVMGGYVYFARDVLKNANLFGVLSACTLLPIVLVAPAMPPLFKKTGKRNALIIGMAVCIAASIVQLIFPYSALIAIIAMSVRALGLGPLMTAAATFPGDIVDYMQWKTNIRAEGIVSSISTVGAKLGTGLGTALLGWFLAAGGYDGALGTQAQPAIDAEIAIVIVVPLILCVLCLIGMCFWDIDKYRPDIDRFLAEQNPGTADV